MSLLLCLCEVIQDSLEGSLIDLAHETLADFGDDSSESSIFEENEVADWFWCVLVGIEKNILFLDVDVKGVKHGLTAGRSEEQFLQCDLLSCTDDASKDGKTGCFDSLLVEERFSESSRLHVVN